MTRTRTNDTTRAIMDFLAYRGHVCWRNNTTGVFNPVTKRFRPAPLSALGTADIICCLKGGRYLEVEVKTGRDALSGHQEAHGMRVAAAGGLYIVAHTFDEFKAQFDQLTGNSK